MELTTTSCGAPVYCCFDIFVFFLFNNFILQEGSMAESKEKDTKPTKKTINKSQPKDALVMVAILKDMGVLDYEPRIINQMLEFTYR